MPLNKEALKPVRHFTKLLFSPFIKQRHCFEFIRTCFVFIIVFCEEPKKKDSLLNTSLEELPKQLLLWD